MRDRRDIEVKRSEKKRRAGTPGIDEGQFETREVGDPGRLQFALCDTPIEKCSERRSVRAICRLSRSAADRLAEKRIESIAQRARRERQRPARIKRAFADQALRKGFDFATVDSGEALRVMHAQAETRRHGDRRFEEFPPQIIVGEQAREQRLRLR